MTRVNIHVPDDVHKRFKIEAAQKDVSLKDLIIKTIEDELETLERKNRGR